MNFNVLLYLCDIVLDRPEPDDQLEPRPVLPPVLPLDAICCPRAPVKLIP
jgi:hypothetical protein